MEILFFLLLFIVEKGKYLKIFVILLIFYRTINL